MTVEQTVALIAVAIAMPNALITAVLLRILSELRQIDRRVNRLELK